MPSRAQRLLGGRLDARRARRRRAKIFVVRKISSRATPLSAIPTPTSRLVPVRARGVDLPVADLERVAYGLASRRSPRSATFRSRAAGPACPGPRWSRSSNSCSYARLPSPQPCFHAWRVATLGASRAISSAGRAPPRQGGGHWFEPSIAHRKVRICGPFVSRHVGRVRRRRTRPSRQSSRQGRGHEDLARAGRDRTNA